MNNPEDEFDWSKDYKLDENKNMNKVSATDVTFMSLALIDFGTATTYLVAHDYAVSGGFVAIGILLVYLYHKIGS